jgi:hypothetical protein
MSRELVFLPEVTQDFVEGFIYYEALSPGRGGSRFQAAFEKALKEIEGGMITHFRHFEHFHRVFLPSFPYNVYYRLVAERAIIAGLLYARFDARRIEETLRNR